MGCCMSSGDKTGDTPKRPLLAEEAGPAQARFRDTGYDPLARGGSPSPAGAGAGAGAGSLRGAAGPRGVMSTSSEYLDSALDESELGGGRGDTDGHLEKNKSLKALKSHKRGTRRYLLHQKIRKIFEEKQHKLHEVVKLPEGEDKNEWVAVHVIDFYNDISLLYGTISALCTPASCPIMSAGSHRYLWADGVTFTTPIKVPAKEYVSYLMDWVDDQLSDEALFVADESIDFPPEFMPSCKVIFKRLFRVYAHIYHSHFPAFVQLGLQQHLNLCFKRFVYFVLEFNMVADKELEPLQVLVSKIRAQAEVPARR